MADEARQSLVFPRMPDSMPKDVKDYLSALEGLLTAALQGVLRVGGDLIVAGDVVTRGPWFDVKAFGATGDGSTDDTVAIQAAIDAAEAAGGGIVFFPKGLYKITTALIISSSDIHIAGLGIGVSIILVAAAAINAFEFGDGTSGKIERNSIRSLSIKASVTKTAGAAIDLDATAWTVVDNVWIEDQYYGIYIHNDGTGAAETANLPFRIYINNCTLRHIVKTNGIGIWQKDMLSELHIVNTEISGEGSSAKCLAGIRLQGGQVSADAGGEYNIIATDTFHCLNGLKIDPVADDQVRWGYFTNCYFDTGYIGAYIYPAGVVESLFFVNCWAGNNTNQGFIFDENGGTIKTVRMIACRSVSNGKSGINISAGDFYDILGCHLSGNSNGASGTYHGIAVANGVNNFTITNCRSGYDNSADWTNSQGYGIAIVGSTHSGVLVANNDCRNNVTGAISNEATLSSTVVIKNNLGYVTENSGSSTGTGAQQTIAHGLSATPTIVIISGDSSNVNGYQSAAADATNIYITADNGEAYHWEARVR